IAFYSADSLPAGTPQLLDLSFLISAGAANGAVSPVNIVTSPATASRLNEGQLSLTPVDGSVTVDNVRPTVVASQFHFENAPQRITVQFSENVKDSLSVNDLTLVNLLNNQTISASDMTLTYDEGANTATITFHDLPGNFLGDGRYRLTISSAGVTDAAAPATAAAVINQVVKAAAASSIPVTTKTKTVAKPAAKVVKPVAVAKPNLTGVTPIQSGPNAPFAAKTKLRSQNKPATLVGDVLEKNKARKLFN